jgi:chemotaxis protein MotB
MRMTHAMGMGLLAATLMLTGCKNSAKQEKAMLEEENANLRNQLTDRNKALEDTSAEKRSLEQQLAAMRHDTTGGTTGTTGDTTTGGSGNMNTNGVTWKDSPGEVTATIQGDILFDSGKATLKPTAKKTLDSVASVIKSKYNGKNVRVAGFTDSDPIRKSAFKDNYALGLARAKAVHDYLRSKGVDERHMTTVSYGASQPKSTKQESRRVEVVVLVNQ